MDCNRQPDSAATVSDGRPKRRKKRRINRNAPVRVDGPAWVRLNSNGTAIEVVYDGPPPSRKLRLDGDHQQ